MEVHVRTPNTQLPFPHRLVILLAAAHLTQPLCALCPALPDRCLPNLSQSEEHNRPYYYNNVTHEVVWEKPADSNVAWIMYHEEL